MSNPSSPNPSNRLPAWFLLLVAIGFPSAAGLTFAQTITQHPLQAVGITLLYEVAIVLISIVTGVWQQLYPDWVKRIAIWLDTRLYMWKYQSDYFEYLRTRYQNVSTKNLISGPSYPLALEQVYIRPILASITIDQASSNLVQSPKALRNSGYSVWDCLTSQPMVSEHLVILGAPGIGKSTLLQDIVLTLTSRKTRRRRPKVVYTLPFFLSLHAFSKSLKDDTSLSLEDVIRSQTPRGKREMPKGWAENRLARGQCLILLDGLDEIVDAENRQQMANWLQAQIDIYGNINRFIATSRPHGYVNNRLDGVRTLRVQEFNARQIRTFIQKWYDASYTREAPHPLKKNRRISARAEEDARDLQKRLQSTPALIWLARNPLLLTMMVIIHQVRDTLPGNRADLYKEMCQIFLERRTRWELPSGQKQKVLQKLAWHMMEKKMVEIEPAQAAAVIKEPLTYGSIEMTPEIFLQTVEKDGIWIEGEQPGTYRFIHKTFGDYLAAVYAKDNQREQILIENIGSDWWHETIFLYCTRGEDASPVMLGCLKEGCLAAEAVEVALDLELYKEKVLARPEVRQQFTHALSQALEDEDVESRHKWAKAFLTRRTRGLDRMVSLDDETRVIDTSLITCAEYQLFLDEQQVCGHNYWPDHWSNNRCLPGQGLMPVLGIRPSDAVAFCNWLTEQDSSGIWRYRLPRAGELEQEDEKLDKVGRLSIGSGYWICEKTHFTWAGEQKTHSITLKQLEDAFKKDKEDRDYYLNSRPYDSILHKSVTLAHALQNVRTIHSELVNALTDACKQILVCNHILQTELKKAQKKVLALQDQIKSEDERETSQDRRIKALKNKIRKDQAVHELAQQEISSLQSRLAEAQQSVHIASDQLERERKRFFLLRNKGREQTLQGQLQEVLQPVNEMDSQFRELLQRESQLQNQINEAQNEKAILQSQYNSKNKGTLALYTRDCAQISLSNQDQIKISAVVATLTRIQKLTSELLSSHSSTSVRELACYLFDCLKDFSKEENRSAERKNRLFRWNIRYFARALAHHLLYWWWKKLPARYTLHPFNKSQQENNRGKHIIDAYLNIYVTFTILEKRIDGDISFPPCEGILLVKEYEEEVTYE